MTSPEKYLDGMKETLSGIEPERMNQAQLEASIALDSACSDTVTLYFEKKDWGERS